MLAVHFCPGERPREAGGAGGVKITNAQCPMPNARCPMPNAPCPMPNAPYPTQFS
ncbi:MAG: hypothetical protein KME31_25820 [Tolypothrix carrinoi HA7290-LM1]|nr:hypothetical protein [Tolypothrix carrinoi HA7290-LM1]